MEIPTISAHRALAPTRFALLFQSRAWVGKLSLGWPSWYLSPASLRPHLYCCLNQGTPKPRETPPPGTGHRHCSFQHPRPPPPSNVKRPSPASYQLIPLPTLFLFFSSPSVIAESDVFPERQCKGTVGISHTNLYLQKLSCHPGMW